MLSIIVRLEHIGDVCVDFMIVILSRALVHIAVLFDEATPTDLTHTLTQD